MAELIWVEAGKKLADGQIGLMEDHPDHPYNETVGANQAKIVKGDPRFNSGQVALTERVSAGIANKTLKETKAPKEAEPDPDPEAEPDADDDAEGEQPQATRGRGRPRSTVAPE